VLGTSLTDSSLGAEDFEMDLALENDNKLMTIASTKNHVMNVVVQSRRVVKIEQDSEVLIEGDQISIQQT